MVLKILPGKEDGESKSRCPRKAECMRKIAKRPRLLECEVQIREWQGIRREREVRGL